MTDTALPEGVALTRVEINAMTPDVVAAVLKQITDNVLKLIPEGSLEKVAKEVITSGKIITITRDRWSGPQETTILSLSDAARVEMAKLLRPEIEKQAAAYLDTAEVKSLIHDNVKAGVVAAIAEVPKYTAAIVMQRMAGGLATDAPPALVNLGIDVGVIKDGVQQAQRALVGKGILMPHEAPLANG